MYATTYYRILLLLLLMGSLVSCGYQIPDGDTHPEIPLFPGITSSTLSIKKLPFHSVYAIKKHDSIFYLLAKKDSNSNNSIYKLNDNFEIINKIGSNNNMTGLSTISNDFFAFSFDSIEKQEQVSIFSPPSYNKEEVLTNSWSVETFQDSLFRLENKNHQFENQSEFYAHMEHSTKQYIKNHITPDLQYIMETDVNMYEGKFIAVYTDRKEYLNWSLDYRKFVPDVPLKKMADFEFIASRFHQNSHLQVFETATLGNNSTGNHYVFGFHPYGLEYQYLIIDKDTATFKTDKAITEIPVNSDKVLLFYEDVIYEIKKL